MSTHRIKVSAFSTHWHAANPITCGLASGTTAGVLQNIKYSQDTSTPVHLGCWQYIKANIFLRPEKPYFWHGKSLSTTQLNFSYYKNFHLYTEFWKFDKWKIIFRRAQNQCLSFQGIHDAPPFMW